MIIMYEHSNPYKKICINNGETKIIELKDYDGKYDQGIAEKVDSETILGMYTESDNLYLVKNNSVFNVTNEEINCINERVNDKRNFELIINGDIFYKKEYNATCSVEDIIGGEIEEDNDFLLYMSNILSSKQSINKFIKGHSIVR